MTRLASSRIVIATLSVTLFAAVLVAPAAQAATPVTLMPGLACPGETAAAAQPSRSSALVGGRPAA